MFQLAGQGWVGADHRILLQSFICFTSQSANFISTYPEECFPPWPLHNGPAIRNRTRGAHPLSSRYQHPPEIYLDKIVRDVYDYWLHCHCQDMYASVCVCVCYLLYTVPVCGLLLGAWSELQQLTAAQRGTLLILQPSLQPESIHRPELQSFEFCFREVSWKSR